MNTEIEANLRDIRQRIEKVAAKACRAAAAVTLIAVSKQQPDDRVDAALAAGQRVFGENRVQEATERWAARRARFPDLRLHLIGPLQTNKALAAVRLFDVIETIDRPPVAEAVVAAMEKAGRRPACFVQVNTGAEPQKGGVLPEELPALLAACRALGLGIGGLMAIPPAAEVPGPHFALLHKLAGRHGLPDLSMGMSHDFETAIALGATYVRVGTAVFGDRGVGA